MRIIIILKLILLSQFTIAQDYRSRVENFEQFLTDNQVSFENTNANKEAISNLLDQSLQEKFGDQQKKKLFINKAKTVLHSKTHNSEQQIYLPLRILYSLYSDEHSPSEYNLKLLQNLITGKRITIKRTGKEFQHNINKTHPAWFTKPNPDRWVELEGEYQNSIEHLTGKTYSLSKAQRVLFLSKIKESATNPKVNVKDAFGMKWKLKWGREVYTEPIANRLYLKMGGKYTDLVYSHGQGRKGVTLILQDHKKAGNCRNINTVKLFKKCLLQSKYEFRIDEFIYDSGKITVNNADRVLKLLIKGKRKYKKKNLYGRTYVTFKSSIVEFQSKDILFRGGPIPFDKLGAQSDIVAKSLLVYNLLIGNMDNKDKNNKNILVYNPIKKSYEYFEYQHDNGSSFGKMFRPRDLNAYRIDSKFFKKKNNRSIFKQFRYFKPKLWENTSIEEAQWMGRHLLRVSDDDIQEIVSHIPWPKFMKTVFSYKLRQRRNDILYALDMTEHKVEKAPNFTLQMNSKEFKTLLEKYNVPKDEITKVMKYGNREDIIIHKGKIATCQNSIIINLLEKYSFPSGLSRSLLTKKDNRALNECRYRH